MAVVKADAYGHGMIECVKALSELPYKPEYYGVALLSEAIEFRKSRLVKEPILCFAPFNLQSLEDYWKYKIIPTLTTPKHVKEVLSIKSNKKLKIHLNINTGMNRLGIKKFTPHLMFEDSQMDHHFLSLKTDLRFALFLGAFCIVMLCIGIYLWVSYEYQKEQDQLGREQQQKLQQVQDDAAPVELE